MGLDITAYERVSPVSADEIPITEDDEDDAYDQGLRQAWTSHFPERAGSIQHNQWYRTEGNTVEFRAGSYGGYNTFRDNLARAAHGVSARDIWDAREEYAGKPFYELIDFSDCEGWMGPEVCAKLAGDFADVGVRERLVKLSQDAWGDDGELYDTWFEAFRLAAGTGAVEFH